MSNQKEKPVASRRKFLSGAAAATAGAATLGFPMIAKAQGPISMRWHSGAPARPSAWTPTCCFPGTSTAAARTC